MLVQFTMPAGNVEFGRLTDQVIVKMVDKWGGCTTSTGIGYWKHPVSGLVEAEPVNVLSVDCMFGNEEPSLYVVRSWFDDVADYVRKQANQHTVHYRAIDATVRLVGPQTILHKVQV